jgi:hypothetical protein
MPSTTSTLPTRWNCSRRRSEQLAQPAALTAAYAATVRSLIAVITALPLVVISPTRAR